MQTNTAIPASPAAPDGGTALWENSICFATFIGDNTPHSTLIVDFETFEIKFQSLLMSCSGFIAKSHKEPIDYR